MRLMEMLSWRKDNKLRKWRQLRKQPKLLTRITTCNATAAADRYAATKDKKYKSDVEANGDMEFAPITVSHFGVWSVSALATLKHIARLATANIADPQRIYCGLQPPLPVTIYGRHVQRARREVQALALTGLQTDTLESKPCLQWRGRQISTLEPRVPTLDTTITCVDGVWAYAAVVCTVLSLWSLVILYEKLEKWSPKPDGKGLVRPRKYWCVMPPPVSKPI